MQRSWRVRLCPLSVDLHLQTCCAETERAFIYETSKCFRVDTIAAMRTRHVKFTPLISWLAFSSVLDLPLLVYLELSLNPPCLSCVFIFNVCHLFLTCSFLVPLKMLLGHFGSQTVIVTGDRLCALGSGGKVNRYWLKQELCVISPAAGAYEYASCPVLSSSPRLLHTCSPLRLLLDGRGETDALAQKHIPGCAQR